MEDALGNLKGYCKTYKMRKLHNDKYICVTLPYIVIQKEATNRGLTVNEFIDGYLAVVEYDNFEGVRYTFTKKGGI